MANRLGELRDPDDYPRLMEAVVRQTDAATGMVYVTVTRQSKTALRGPCPFQRQVLDDGTPISPEPGDLAWVEYADTGRLVIVTWWRP